MISKETVSLIRQQTDLLGLVAEHVPSFQGMHELYKRRLARGQPGHRYCGRCPFHEGPDPSTLNLDAEGSDDYLRQATLEVNTETRLWHCVECRATGDAFTFLERALGISFAAALRLLATRADVSLNTGP
jgi:hypothetical protein